MSEVELSRSRLPRREIVGKCLFELRKIQFLKLKNIFAKFEECGFNLLESNGRTIDVTYDQIANPEGQA